MEKENRTSFWIHQDMITLQKNKKKENTKELNPDMDHFFYGLLRL